MGVQQREGEREQGRAALGLTDQRDKAAEHNGSLPGEDSRGLIGLVAHVLTLKRGIVLALLAPNMNAVEEPPIQRQEGVWLHVRMARLYDGTERVYLGCSSALHFYFLFLSISAILLSFSVPQQHSPGQVRSGQVRSDQVRLRTRRQQHHPC